MRPASQLAESGTVAFPVVGEKKVNAGIGGAVGCFHDPRPYAPEIRAPVILTRNFLDRPSDALGTSLGALMGAKRDAPDDHEWTGHHFFWSDRSASIARNGMRRSRISSAVK